MSKIFNVTVGIEGPDGFASGTVTLRLEQAVVAPTIATEPFIEGEAEVGGVLSVMHDGIAGAPPPTISYRWRRDEQTITDTEGKQYITVPEDDGHQIDCVVTAENSAGRASAAAAAVRVIVAAPKLSSQPTARTFKEGSGVQVVDVTDAFTGINLGYSLTDESLSDYVDLDLVAGRLAVDTNKSGARNLLPMTVRATNSGGSVEVDFPIEIEPMFDVFVSSRDGDDANDGLSMASPKRTLSAGFGLATTGSRIGIARGSVYREEGTVPAAGVTIGAYGTGDKPLISGSEIVTGWTADAVEPINQFSNADTLSGWIKQASSTVQDAPDPDGGTAAHRMILTTTNGAHRLYRVTSSFGAADTNCSIGAQVKSGIHDWVRITATWRNSSNVEVTSEIGGYFQISTGASSGLSAGLTADVGPLVDGWRRVGFTMAKPATGDHFFYSLYVATGAGAFVFAGDGTSTSISVHKPYAQKTFAVAKGVYSATSAPPNRDLVWLDESTLLTKRASLAALQSAASGWFHDGAALRVKLVGSANPTAHVIERCARLYALVRYGSGSHDGVTIRDIAGMHCGDWTFMNYNNVGWIFERCEGRYSFYGHFDHRSAGRSLTGCVTKDCIVGRVDNPPVVNYFASGIRAAGTPGVLITGNTVATVNTIAIWVDEQNAGATGGQASPGAVVRYNDVTDCLGGISLWGAPDSKVHHNHVHDSRGYGLNVATNAHRVHLHHNLVHDLTIAQDGSLYNGIDINGGPQNGLLDHNTVAGVCNYCVTLEDDTAGSDGWTVRDNIFDARANVPHPAQVKSGSTGCLSIHDGTNEKTLLLENNCYVAKVGAEHAVFEHGDAAEQFFDYAGMLAFTGEGGSINPSEPGFMDVANDDYTLTPASPCVKTASDGSNRGALHMAT